MTSFEVRHGDLPSQAVGFFTSENLPEKVLIGYEKQLKVGLGVGLKVEEGGFLKVLGFGYPGTGKSTFPYTLAHRLKSDFGKHFSLAYINCEYFSALDKPMSIGRNLNKFWEDVYENRPVILFVDEMDTLSDDTYKLGIPVKVLFQWLSHLLRQNFEQTLVFGVSSYPKRINRSIFRLFRSFLYFPPSNEEMISEIFRKYLDVEDSHSVTEILIKRLEKFDLKLMSSDAITACDEINLSIGTLKGYPAEKVVEILQDYIAPCNCSHFIADYKEEYSHLIRYSEKQSSILDRSV